MNTISLATLLAAALAVAPVQAQTQSGFDYCDCDEAFAPLQEFEFFGAGGMTEGWRFQAETDLVVTQLGVYKMLDPDAQSAAQGLWAVAPLGIYTYPEGDLVREVTLSPGTPYDRVGTYIYADIEPLPVQAGEQYLLARYHLPGSTQDPVPTYDSWPNLLLIFDQTGPVSEVLPFESLVTPAISLPEPSGFTGSGAGELEFPIFSPLSDPGFNAGAINFQFELDCNGNGVGDGAELASGAALDLDADGQLDTCQPFSADVGTLFLAAGGSVQFALDGGAPGDIYIVLGSLSGTSPGLPLAGATLPLNPDAYLSLTASGAGVLTGGIGTLDAQGAGAASFAAAPGQLPGQLAGTTVHHGFVSVDPLTAAIDVVSNAIPTLFQP